MGIQRQILFFSKVLVLTIAIFFLSCFSFSHFTSSVTLYAVLISAILTIVFALIVITLLRVILTTSKKILDMSQVMGTIRNFEKLLRYILDETAKILNAERVSLFLFDREKDELWTFIAQKLEIKEIRLPAGKGIVGHVINTGKLLNVKKAYKDPRFDPEIDKRSGFKTKNILCVPMLDRMGKVFGAVEVLNKLKGNFSDTDEYLLTSLTQQIQISIENSQLYETKEKLLISILKTLVATIDARDPTTRGHSERVTKYALAVGREMKLSEEDMQVLEYAAILHDIGKIGISDSILLKPDKYTSEEYNIVKTHAIQTKEILEKIYFTDFQKKIPMIAATHHEKLDGSGYPYGLKGQQIPLLSRIIAIVDIYDAMVSFDRPYKAAMSIEEALSFLKSQAAEGKLDKDIVDIFINKKLYLFERRKFIRIDAEFSFEYKLILPDELRTYSKVLAYTSDISGGGLMFISNEEIPVESHLDLILHLPGYTVESIGKVVHLTKLDEKDYRVGVMFLSLSEEMKTKLEKYIVQWTEKGGEGNGDKGG